MAAHGGVAIDVTSVAHDAFALRDFDRWATWMWANTDVAAFSRWLRTLNEGRAQDRRVGFYGPDVYSLWDTSGG